LAEVLVKIITFCESVPPSGVRGLFGIYHFSNEGKCSWYYFAKKIFEFNNININVEPIPTTSFPTPAQRPAYSVLNKSKIKNIFGVEVKYWEMSLKNM
ncbi:MAG: sugar nucleotide-binding protein, partial [Flavobacterium sp.]